MIIGVLKEIKPNEYRVAAIPATVKEITARGHQVLVQQGAGTGSGYSDAEYEAAGAVILPTADEVYRQADLFYKVKEFFPEEYQYMGRDKIIFTYIHSNAHPEETDAILDSHVTAFAYEDITDDDGNFPLLKPMSILAGKGAFLAALHHMQAVFGGAGTLLSNVTGIEAPVVTIIGAGNSGIGAAELAAGFGNTVRILDVNMKAMEAAMACGTADKFVETMGTPAYYGGLKEGFVDISPLSENCAAGTAEAIEAVKALMISGEWDVFSGVKLEIAKDGTVTKVDAPLVDNQGNEIVAAGGASVEDGVITGTMNYFVAGVEEA